MSDKKEFEIKEERFQIPGFNQALNQLMFDQHLHETGQTVEDFRQKVRKQMTNED